MSYLFDLTLRAVFLTITCNLVSLLCDYLLFCAGNMYRRGARRWRKLYRVNGHLFQAKRFSRVSLNTCGWVGWGTSETSAVWRRATRPQLSCFASEEEQVNTWSGFHTPLISSRGFCRVCFSPVHDSESCFLLRCFADTNSCSARTECF